MSVKIRLQRHGKKGKPFYWVVAADARSKRDGKFLEKIGTYNPNTNPATIDLNLDKTVQLLHNRTQCQTFTKLSTCKQSYRVSTRVCGSEAGARQESYKASEQSHQSNTVLF